MPLMRAKLLDERERRLQSQGVQIHRLTELDQASAKVPVLFQDHTGRPVVPPHECGHETVLFEFHVIDYARVEQGPLRSNLVAVIRPQRGQERVKERFEFFVVSEKVRANAR